MKTNWQVLGLILISSAFLSFAPLNGADEILGLWWNHEKDAHIEIYKCGVQYCGKIVWLKEPNENDAPKKDKNNPDESLQKRPLIGLDILSGFEFKEEGSWDDGNIYNPRDGKTYSCYLKMLEEGRLKVRGFVGISLIGKTQYWEKVQR
ncbi:MAG: DUF2147 domain-containing protein [Cyclobacteriaceae bacterium]|nr:DUF2147 domain-containing protein [Cyclobacteriaceae bacterium]